MRIHFNVISIVFYFVLRFCHYIVGGDANFFMKSTQLTVGGFTQPGVARSLIEMPANAEKGLSHRFLWLFPNPLFEKFSNLGDVNKDFVKRISKYTQHNYELGEEVNFWQFSK